jgi:hypothetical protein
MMAEVQSGEAGGVAGAGACASAGYGVCVRVWCGVVWCILHIACHITHKHAGCDEWGYSGGWNCDFTKKDHGRELTRGAVDSVALAHSVCVYLSHVPRYLREQFQGEYGQVPWRP